MGWFNRKPKPTVRDERIGTVRTDSGTLLLADPTYLSADSLRIDGLPPGVHPVTARLIRYPEGGQRVAAIALGVRPGRGDRRPLGEVGVDSAKVALLDEQAYRDHWHDVGPERVGVSISEDAIRLIGERFGLRWRRRDDCYFAFDEPIPVAREADIRAFLAGQPKYAKFAAIHFMIRTGDTAGRVADALLERWWAEVELAPGAGVFAVSSGFGDGSYPVEGVYGPDGLRAVEVTFIGPEQDELLAAFPALRY